MIAMLSDPIKWLNYQYELSMEDYIYDAEVDSWFLMNNATPVLIILSVYLLFVLKVGPQFMENRKPFDLKNTLLFYNLAISLLNGFIFLLLLWGTTDYPVKYLCTPPPNKVMLPSTRAVFKSCWYFFISKIIELLDTVFFVLRKKKSQITILHVYHHTFMVFHSWWYLKYLKSAPEQGLVAGLLNSFVHIIMYLYYFLAALGPDIQKHLWWKKYLTVLQMGQFGIILTFLLTLLMINCKVHHGLSVYMFVNTFVFLAMFANFYRKAYRKKKVKSVNLVTDPDAPDKNYIRVKYE